MLLLTSRCKLTPAQCKRHYYLSPPQSLPRKQIKAKLMLCKLLFIIHITVKRPFKSYTGVLKHSARIAKSGHGTCIMRFYKC